MQIVYRFLYLKYKVYINSHPLYYLYPALNRR